MDICQKSDVLKHNIGHTLINQIKCSNCNFYSEESVDNYILILNLPNTTSGKNRIYELNDIINYNYNNYKSLDIKCNNCQRTLKHKTIIKSKRNKIYILHLSLFFVDNLNNLSKIKNCKISKLPKTEIFIDNKRYKMINTIFHHGNNIDSGHYTNMLKASD